MLLKIIEHNNETKQIFTRFYEVNSVDIPGVIYDDEIMNALSSDLMLIVLKKGVICYYRENLGKEIKDIDFNLGTSNDPYADYLQDTEVIKIELYDKNSNLIWSWNQNEDISPHFASN